MLEMENRETDNLRWKLWLYPQKWKHKLHSLRYHLDSSEKSRNHTSSGSVCMHTKLQAVCVFKHNIWWSSRAHCAQLQRNWKMQQMGYGVSPSHPNHYQCRFATFNSQEKNSIHYNLTHPKHTTKWITSQSDRASKPLVIWVRPKHTLRIKIYSDPHIHVTQQYK